MANQRNKKEKAAQGRTQKESDFRVFNFSIYIKKNNNKKNGYRVPDFPKFAIRIRPEYPVLKPGTRPGLSEFWKPGNLSPFKNRKASFRIGFSDTDIFEHPYQ